MYSTVIIDRQSKSLAVLYSFFNRNRRLKITGTFQNYCDAMVFIKKQPPAIIIIDMGTLYRNGPLHWDQIKSLQNKSCIFITSYHLDNTVKQLAEEVSGYLLKPVGQEDIENMVNQVKIARKTKPELDKV